MALEPDGAYVTGFLGFALNWAGRPEEGLNLAQKAMHFSPLHPSWYIGVAAHSCRLLGRHQDALLFYEKAIKQTPDYISAHIGLTANYVEMGRLGDARAQGEAVMRIDPKFSIARYAAAQTYKKPEHAARSLNALREAGLPD